MLTCGVFDLLHRGHFRFLSQAAALGELTVGLLTDRLATEYKRRPVLPYGEREATLLELPWVARVVEKGTHDIKPLLDLVEPDWLALGSDWGQERFFTLNEVTAADLEARSIGLVFLPRLSAEVSTTNLIGAVMESQS